MITNIKIDNFKSLKGIDTTFGPMNFIVGPNASGKSNFAEALDFVSHAISEDLSYAVAEKGGFYNICYRRQRRARGAISFAITGQVSRQREMYDFTLSFQLRTRGEDIRADFYIDTEILEVRLRDQNAGGRVAGEITIWRSGSHYDIEVRRHTGEGIELSARQKNFLSKCEALTPFLRSSADAAAQSLFLSSFLRDYFPLSLIARELRGLRVFQLNPRIARQPAAPSVHGDLGRRGENLASAVDRMRIEHERDFKKLCEWLRDVVPALAAVLTDYTETRQLGLFFQEEGFTSRWFAEDVSDGTIMSVGLFFALLDRRHKTVVIEEPETSLHPWILKKFLERCRQQSPRRQIIITTHSPLAVAQAEPAELFLIERQEGITVLKRAIEQEADLAKIIRRDFLNLGEYWLSGGLGAVPQVPDVQDEELFPRPN